MDMINLVDLAFIALGAGGFFYFLFKERDVRKAIAADVDFLKARIEDIKAAKEVVDQIATKVAEVSTKVDAVADKVKKVKAPK